MACILKQLRTGKVLRFNSIDIANMLDERNTVQNDQSIGLEKIFTYFNIRTFWADFKVFLHFCIISHTLSQYN